MCDYCGADRCHWTRHAEARAEVDRAAREDLAASREGSPDPDTDWS